VREEMQSIILFFPASEQWKLSLNNKRSFIKINHDGTAVVFITPEDYKFLKVPISYHLLCEKVAERFKESYELFEQGDNAGALAVFKVEKAVKKKGREGR